MAAGRKKTAIEARAAAFITRNVFAGEGRRLREDVGETKPLRRGESQPRGPGSEKGGPEPGVREDSGGGKKDQNQPREHDAPEFVREKVEPHAIAAGESFGDSGMHLP